MENLKQNRPEVNGYSITANASGFMPFAKDFKIPHLNRDTTLHVDVYLTPLAKQLELAGDVIDKEAPTTKLQLPNYQLFKKYIGWIFRPPSMTEVIIKTFQA